MAWPFLILMGSFTGACGVMIGSGGGFILGPMLLINTDMEPSVVAGTVLAAGAVNSISGSYAYHRMRLIDFRSGLLFAVVAIPGSVIGAFGIEHISSELFRFLFGLLLLVLASQIIIKPRQHNRDYIPIHGRQSSASRGVRHIRTKDGDEHRYEFNEIYASSFNFGLGFISSFFGTGGGFIRTPVLVLYFRFPVQVAAATSIFALSIYTTVGAAVHAALGHVQWFPDFVFMGVGLLVGGQFGAWSTGYLKKVWLMRALGVMLVVIGIRLALGGFFSW
ncbi:sulfite exporter TauE/SafE family protein [Dehalococcoidia bacterium]|nr:sulfite exporter TauE/SafE family protein [Dehalococcoidia bacterium]